MALHHSGAQLKRRCAIPFVLSSIVLFAMGAFVAFLTLPKALEFLLDVGGSQLRPELTADKYLSFVMAVAFGVAFEFPVVLVFLLLARVVTARQLRRWHGRRP